MDKECQLEKKLERITDIPASQDYGFSLQYHRGRWYAVTGSCPMSTPSDIADLTQYPSDKTPIGALDAYIEKNFWG